MFGYNWSENPGDGSEANPYQISEPNHLIAINDLDTTGIHFVLMNDIDLDPNLPGNQIFNRAVIASQVAFEGTFDGQGYAIRNLQIIDETEGVSFIGLFGKIGPDGFVKNFSIKDYDIRVKISWNLGFAGSLAGQNLGIVFNCISNGTAGPVVEGKPFQCLIAGLVGINGNYKYNTSSEDDNRGLIANSGSHSNLTTLYGGAGLVSYNFGSIYQCYSQSHISDGVLSSMDSNGGLIGINSGVVNQSFSNNIMETESNSGLIGYNNGIVRNCYALGVMAETQYGGLAAGLVAANYDYEGNKGARIENCYSACQLGSEGYVQGLAGGDYYFYGTALSSFWDVDVSGTTESCGGKGLTTAEMKDANILINAGWDFVGETTNGAEDIWQIDPNVNNGYPSLVFKSIDGGDGSAANPCIIYTKQQLLDFFNDPAMWDKHIKLIVNIDLSETTFTSPPIDTFNGVFDGSGCTIDGLTVDGSGTSGELGLFNVVGRNGCVKNLYLKNASMTNGTGGILATLNTGKILDCHVAGSVEGGEYCGGIVAINENLVLRCSADCNVSGSMMSFGGLVGFNSFFGDISESYSEGTVDSSGYSGGLVGENWGKIQHSYSTASVTGTWETGALVGNNELGVVICCYATGQVADDKLVGFNRLGVVAHSYYGGYIVFPEAWEGNSWYEEDGHIWTTNEMLPGQLSLKWQRWGTPVSLENLHASVPFYRQNPTRDGSAEHPYRFSFEMANYPADWDKHFEMTDDADMAMCGAPVFDQAVIPYFNGTLDGGGHVVRNLVLENQNDFQSMGFFGMLGYDAQIRQLGIEGEVDYFGRFPALLAGVNFGTLEECYAKGSVSCSTSGGILTGFNGGAIRNCYTKGTLTLEYIPDMWDETRIEGGGLYGRSWGRVMNSYVDVETIYADDQPVVSGVGGLNEGLVWNSFWNSDLVDPNLSLGGTPLTAEQLQDVNSFIGWGDNIWKIADGNDTPRLMWENTEWDTVSGIPSEQWPEYEPMVDAPRNYGGGNGTAQSPYVLTTAEHLFTVGKYLSDSDKYFALGNDIDLSGQTLSESIIGYFTGKFNGSGHTISGLTIDGLQSTGQYHARNTNCIGLFGCVDTGGVVENISIENVNIDGMCTVGVLAGENNGVIRRSSATGHVIARGNLGGLIGANGFRRMANIAVIEDCYTNLDIDGYALQNYAVKYLGGIAGANNGMINRCYATGTIEAYNNLGYGYSPFITGGITGWSNSGRVQDSYYSSTSGENPIGTQLDVAQMKQRANFTTWDFVGDGNGNQDIWRMCVDGVSYPRLSWEFSRNGDFACPDGVGLDDLAALGDNWLGSLKTRPEAFNYACDANSDGVIDLLDFAVLAANWLVD
jgi:hypothetical protein